MTTGVKMWVPLLVSCVLLSGCAAREAHLPVRAAASLDVPSEALIRRIEAHLERGACVGSLDRWARFYRWGTHPSDFVGDRPRATTHDRRAEVEIVLREAGKFGYRAGSYIEPSPPPLERNEVYIELDDRDYRVAFGTYVVASDTLQLRTCGGNIAR
jgi:hypothetical protein